MTDAQKQLAREFGEIAHQKGFCFTVCFTAGAIAFSEEAVANNEQDKIMQEMIELAKEKNENDFMESIIARY